jgi:uracil-DNA glycosylase family 4
MLRAMGVSWPAAAPARQPPSMMPPAVPAAAGAGPSPLAAPDAPAKLVPVVAVAHNAAADWAAHAAQVQGCQGCDLAQQRAAVLLAQGEPNTARWLFVAAHPSSQAEPGLVLPPEQQALWQAMGHALGLPPAAMMLTALTKCVPAPGHWPSQAHEIACQPHGRDTVALLRPDVVIALGAHVARRLLQLPPDTPLGALRGQVHRYHGTPLVVTHALDALLTRHGDKAQAWEDLCLAHQNCPPTMAA